MLPSERSGFPRETTYWDGSTERDQVHDRGPHACGHVATVKAEYAPDTRRNWFRCTGCDAEWNGDNQEGSRRP